MRHFTWLFVGEDGRDLGFSCVVKASRILALSY